MFIPTKEEWRARMMEKQRDREAKYLKKEIRVAGDQLALPACAAEKQMGGQTECRSAITYLQLLRPAS